MAIRWIYLDSEDGRAERVAAAAPKDSHLRHEVW